MDVAERGFDSSRASVLCWYLAISSALGSASCHLDDTTDWSPYPPLQSIPAEAEPEPELEPESYEARAARLPPEWSEQEKVEGLLYSYCGECHGSDLVGRPEFYECTHCFIDDIERLVEENLIVPGNPEESSVYQSMVDGRMPPGGPPGAPAELIERVGAFIASLCPTDDRECQAGTDAAD